MSAEETVTVCWTYAGRRLGDTTKPVHEWVDTDDKARRFAGVAGSAVGGIYEIDTTPDGSQCYPGSLKFTGDKLDDPDRVAQWQLLDKQTRATVAMQAAERRASKHTELESAMAPLIRVVQGCRTRADANAVIQRIQADLTEAWWSK